MGFDVGTCDELVEQGRYGGYRMPGVVFMKYSTPEAKTSMDLSRLVQNGHSLTHLLTHSLTHLLTYLLTQSPTHSLIYSLTHSLRLDNACGITVSSGSIR